MAIGLETTWNPTDLPPAPLRRFTVEEYHRMIETGVFGPEDRVELLNGWIVTMSPHGPPHDTALLLTETAVEELLPPGWVLRGQSSITLSGSEPEPDVAVVRGDARRYAKRHPAPGDIGLLIEVAESSLRYDQKEKAPEYAREGVTAYWIVNLPESRVEVYTDPTPDGYRSRRDYGLADSIPLVLDGGEVGRIAVRDLLP